MELRIRKTGVVMLENSFRQYLKDNNGPSYDVLTLEIMEALEVDPVFEGPQASGGTVYQYSQRDGVENINGQWFTKHILGPVFADTTDPVTQTITTAAEQEATYKLTKDKEQAQSVRSQRDTTLAKSDWRIIKALEAGAPPDFAWAQYRQELRDVTNQDGFPWSVVWPIEPV